MSGAYANMVVQLHNNPHIVHCCLVKMSAWKGEVLLTIKNQLHVVVVFVPHLCHIKDGRATAFDSLQSVLQHLIWMGMGGEGKITVVWYWVTDGGGILHGILYICVVILWNKGES